ncbi:MAG: DUF3306 domain-containing protein [Rubrivivax sp.]|nr:DUF3306 domain-containing protein [Rubrivivax sp.]
MTAEEGSFLSRWSRRKAQAGAATPTPLPPPPAAGALVARETPLAVSVPVEASAPREPVQSAAMGALGGVPSPTLEDVEVLTHDSDYTKFVARGVTPEVRNAALKKLFTDPQFNVMDGLDTYIGDYHTPDPLPPGMLRQMVQSHLLGLFDDEEKDSGTPAPDTRAPLAATPVDAPLIEAPSPTEPACHENADLQLQPDDDAGCAGPAPGPGTDTGGPH